MSVPLSTVEAARKVFQEGWERNSQQLISRFRDYAVVKTGLKGKSVTFKKIQKREMSLQTGRFQPVNPQEQTWEYRHLFPKKAFLDTWIDEDDDSELALGVAPTGEIIMEHNSAAARQLDDFFLAGIMGANLEGFEDNVTSIAIPNSQIVAVNYRRDGGSANTGLTLAKLGKVVSRFGKNEVTGQDVDNPESEICMASSQDELDNLVLDVEQTQNSRYSDVMALKEGRVNRFLGIRFIRTERLPYTTSGGKIIRTCPAWVKSKVRLGVWDDITTKIDVLTNPSGTIQIHSKLRVNSCRMDEDAVVLTLCEQDIPA